MVISNSNFSSRRNVTLQPLLESLFWYPLILSSDFISFENRYPWMKLMLLASSNEFQWLELTHWGWVTHICVCKLTIIGSDNGLSPDRRQAIIWTNAGILLIWPLGTNFSEMLIEIYTSLFKKMHLKLSSGKWRPFCLGLNVLKIRHHDSNPSIGCQWPLLLTWFNFNPSMDK